jgi:hypothetical protein
MRPDGRLRHALVALGRSQINSFSLQSARLLAHSNSRSRGLHEIRRIGRTLRASVPVCGELLILAECTEEVQTCESFASR